MKTKKYAFVMISLLIVGVSISGVSAADYNVNSLADVSGIASWLTGGATAGDTLFFNLNPSDIINSLSNIVVNVSINIVSNTGTIIQGTAANNLFTVTANNVNISGLTVNGFNQAITVNGGNQSTIQNNSFNNNTGSVAIYNSNGSKVSNNTIKNNGNNNAIGLGNSNYTKVDGNTISNSNGTGVATWDSHDNEISNNKINTVSNGDGVYAQGSNHKIESNEIENAGSGINVRESNNIQISKNKANNNRYSGITVYQSNNTKIKDNSANYNKHNGIVSTRTSYTSIVNNTCNYNGNDSYLDSGFYNGIHISENSTFSSIINNTAEGNYRSGISIGRDGSGSTCNDTIIKGNIVKYNKNDGISLIYSMRSIVENNTAEYNNYSGISIARGLGHKIINNIIKGNNLSGIYAGSLYILFNGTKNEITNNTILENYEGITIAGSNNTISKNTLINNYIGIKLSNYIKYDPNYNSFSSINTENNTFEYNRIVNSTQNLFIEFLTTQWNTTGNISNNSGNFNWWGLNNPEDSIFQNSSAFNASYWFVTNLTSMQDSVNKTDSARFNYTIGLNDPTILADPMKLPHFTFTVDGKSYDARKNQVLSKAYDEVGDHIFGFFVDNQWLEAKVKVIDIPGPNPTPNNTTNNTNNTNNTNHVNGTDVAANAGVNMKNTGIPFMALLITLITTLLVAIRKKQ